MPLAQVLAMEPWEWDAWKARWRTHPRFDPWQAASLICAVVIDALTRKKGDPPTDAMAFYPRMEKVRPGKRKPSAKGPKPRGRKVSPGAAAKSSEAFDRMMGI